MPTVAEQLASVWDYISGAGTLVEDYAIAVWREGRFHLYSTFVPIDEIGYFRFGEGIWLYATQDCVLTYKGMTTPLYAGWNNIAWLVDEEPPATWMDMLMPIIMIGMMGYMMWPMIKGLFKKDK
ncbi:hypothetical protein M1N92_00860 [Dehalococcoidia bacterium]|nr:hypothetical protein [Dehalococcoidia bacterium]